jgi:salicylate hydroxylase
MTAQVLREHHNVTILERFQGGHGIEAAISFGSPAAKLAKQIGSDRKRIGSVPWAETQTFDNEGNHMHTYYMRKFSMSHEL